MTELTRGQRGKTSGEVRKGLGREQQEAERGALATFSRVGLPWPASARLIWCSQAPAASLLSAERCLPSCRSCGAAAGVGKEGNGKVDEKGVRGKGGRTCVASP